MSITADAADFRPAPKAAAPKLEWGAAWRALQRLLKVLLRRATTVKKTHHRAHHTVWSKHKHKFGNDEPVGVGAGLKARAALSIGKTLSSVMSNQAFLGTMVSQMK